MAENKKFVFTRLEPEIAHRRKHARIPVEIKGTLTYADAEKRFTSPILITSLSTGGLGFETNAVILPGDFISVSFPLEGKIITENAQITRRTGKEAGCRFLSPNPENVKLIQQYIYKKVFS